jgi:hypothetical protein
MKENQHGFYMNMPPTLEINMNCGSAGDNWDLAIQELMQAYHLTIRKMDAEWKRVTISTGWAPCVILYYSS